MEKNPKPCLEICLDFTSFKNPLKISWMESAQYIEHETETLTLMLSNVSQQMQEKVGSGANIDQI